MVKIGGHYFGVYNIQDLESIIKHVKEINATAFQIFVGNESKTTLRYKAQFTAEDFKKARELLKKNELTLVIHSNLALNFGNPMTSGRYRWMLENIRYDMEFADKIGAIGCVIHTGFKTHTKNEAEAIMNMANNIKLVLHESKISMKPKIIIETSAGQKNRIATSIQELKILYDKIPKQYQSRVGFCVDSCHIFSAGYKINTKEGIEDYFQNFDKIIGVEKILIAHLNDSKEGFNSRLDKHENLTRGMLFNNIQILQKYLEYIKDNVIILETREPAKYKQEIALVRKLLKMH